MLSMPLLYSFILSMKGEGQQMSCLFTGCGEVTSGPYENHRHCRDEVNNSMSKKCEKNIW